jgi:2-dehydro-3-deoxyglucarate aldolase/4-hydroxy-2-oxoheptanedioate aldolase
MRNEFKQRVKQGEKLIGAFVCLPVPESAEIFAELGYDWLILDTEHGPYGTLTVQRMVQAVAGRSACIVRIPSNEEVWIKKALDTGADGVLVPLVNTAEVAGRVAAACRYAPAGTRGMGGARCHRYGAGFQDYVDRAEEKVSVIVQAEHAEAVANIEAIAAVPGIDGIFIGPYDLSASLGKPGRIDAPEVQATIRKVREATLAAGLALGIYCDTADTAARYLGQGFTLIGMSTDLACLIRAAGQALEQARRAV